MTAWTALRDGTWMTRERATAYLVILIIANVFGFTFAVCHAHGFFMEKEAHFSTEFMGFYAAGKLIDQGTASLVYDPGMPAQAYIESLHMAPAHDAMQRALAGDPKLVLFASFYPPVFWLVCAPLARLSYYVAFLLWVGASLAFFLYSLRAVVGSWKALWPVPAYLSFYACAGVGENSFLSAGLLTFGLVQLEKRPLLAGFLFGLLAFKPHFTLPVAIMLLAGKHWRAIAAAAVSGTFLCAHTGFVFGWARWTEYLGVVAPHAHWMLRHDGFSYAIQVTTFSGVRLLHGPIWLADLLQLATTLFGGVAVFVASRWGKPDVRAATLALSFPLILSVMLDYDLTVCAVAIPFFWQAMSRTGARPWEKTALVGLFALPVVSFFVRFQLHFPADTLLLVWLTLVLLKRVRAEHRGTTALPESLVVVQGSRGNNSVGRVQASQA